MSRQLARQFHTTRPTLIIKNLIKTLENTAPKPFIVKAVNRPIGFPKPPVADSQFSKEKTTIWTRFKDVFDNEKKAARRKELEDEMSKSGFHDAHYYTKYNGKLFVPPISFFKSDKSLYFPNLTGESLKDQMVDTTNLFKGKITVLRILSSQTGEKHNDTFFKTPNSQKSYLTDGYDEFLTKYPHAQIAELNLSENNAKHLLISFARKNLKKLVPEKRHHLYLTGRRSDVSKEIKDAIMMNNKYACNMYVLDADCKIRWLTIGPASEQEYALFYRCLDSLEKELDAAADVVEGN